jgi:GH25 family lysozyme M1 (1,4-beta-N-acetylmuramidase)
MFGADLASVDDPGQPHWETAKASGLGFVFLRAAWGTLVDVFYGPQAPRLRALGIPYGSYLFLRFPFKGSTPANPELQARAMIQTAGNAPDFPPVLDIEFPGNGFVDTGMTHAQALDWIRRAVKTLRDYYKCSPILYTSARVIHEDLGDPDMSEFVDSPLWLAHYQLAARKPAQLDAVPVAPQVPASWGAGNYWIHQYQGDALGVPGFGCAVDLNKFNYMKLGESGERVMWVQARLGTVCDGNFGLATELAVKALQAKNNLTADGVIGPKTFAKLCWIPGDGKIG